MEMLDIKNLKHLMFTVAKADKGAPVAYSFGEKSYSYEQTNELLREQLKMLGGTYALYRRNKETIFELLEETADEVLPKKVIDAFSRWAEIKQVGQGNKVVFKQRISAASKRRAKQFITKVGLAGIYETFRLAGTEFEIKTSAIGGAAQIGFEEFLDGTVDFADVLEVVVEGIEEAIYLEIERALQSITEVIPVANSHSQAGFNEASFDKLLNIADAYGGSPATIVCTAEFAGTMAPADSNMWSEGMKSEKWTNGYFARYKNHPVEIIPQSFEDETNTTKVIDPAYAYILPTSSAKPVKIVFEGDTIVREIENSDMSREVQMYKKVGVGVVTTNDLCVYKNTSLVKQ